MTTYYKATLCACGCGGPVRPKTPGRKARYIHGHNPVPPRTEPLEVRWRRRVAFAGPDECWPWTGGHDTDGRGRVWFNGRNIPATRVALMLMGWAIPAGSFICHTCDNPPCVNPRHLYVGSALTNVRDMDERGRRVARVPKPGARGEKNHNARLSDAAVAEIRQKYTGARGEQTRLAREYGVTQALVSLIVGGAYRA